MTKNTLDDLWKKISEWEKEAEKDMDLIERETARRIIDSPRTKEQMLIMLESVPSVYEGKKVDWEKMVEMVDAATEVLE